ncbi:MAG: hypothetical protein AAF708_19135 [Deinococcota bacterium]
MTVPPANTLTIVGHADAQALLATLAAHTLLFTGPPGVGKRSTAYWLAARYNCTAAQADRPCGTCPSCQLFLAGQHPDYREVRPQQTTKSGRLSRRPIISIGQLVPRDSSGDTEPLSTWLEQRPRFARRVAVIVSADTLTDEAANAFLKLLEEPPSYATIVLTASSGDSVLPTVVSRATPLRFGALQQADLDTLASASLASDSLAHSTFQHPLTRLGRARDVYIQTQQPEEVGTLVKGVDDYVEALSGSLEQAFVQADMLEKAWSSPDQAIAVVDLLRAKLSTWPPTPRAQALSHVDACAEALESYATASLAVQCLTLNLRKTLVT